MSTVRKTLVRTHIYQFFNFLSHLTLKRKRTVKQYQNLSAGKYLDTWQMKFLIKHKAKGNL